MICLIGDSASGKSTIEKILANRYGYQRIISYTSRSKRENEVEDVDYHFISEEEFVEKLSDGFFAEHTVYNGWHYGIAKKDCVSNGLAVVEPVGYKRLSKLETIPVIVSFYLKVPERQRVVRMMKRGDNLMESFRRIISDQGSFNGIEDEVTFVVDNDDNQTPDETADVIVALLDYVGV